MSDVLLLGAAFGLATAASAITGFVVRTAARRPLLAKVSELEATLTREANGARRRELDAAKRHAEVERRLRGALGLPVATDDLATPSGRALAESVVERVRGLATVDACVVADELGLAWTGDGSDGGDHLAAAASVVFATTLRHTQPRALHVELDDARHVVVRPVPGTLPRLALGTLSTSRPASPFALDAALAHATLNVPRGDDATDANGVSGWAYRVSRADAPVTEVLLGELQQAATDLGCGAMALLVGDEVVAAYAQDGPREDDLAPFAIALRDAIGRVGTRMGARPMRLDWSGPDGTTISIAPLGASGRTTVLAVRRAGAVEVRAFDRLGGRLRRLLPAEPAGRRDEVRP